MIFTRTSAMTRSVIFRACLLLSAGSAAATELAVSDEQLRQLGIEFRTLDATERSTITLATLPGIAMVPDSQAQTISLPFEGRVEDWHLNSGSALAAGDNLVALHSHDVLNFFQGNRRQQQASKLCDQRLSDMRERSKSGLTSRLDLQEQELRCQQMRDQLQLNKQVLQHLPAAWQNNNSAEFEFSAAADGWLKSILRSPGEHFAAGEALAVFWPAEQLQLRLMVPAGIAAGLSINSQVGVTDPQTGAQQQGRIIRIGKVENEAGQITVWLRADSLLPGAVFRVQLPTSGTGWAVPASSRVRQGDASWVFLRSANGVTVYQLQTFTAGSDALLLQDNNLTGQQIAVSGTATLKSLWQSAEEE